MLVGLISDTHGRLSQTALDALEGCDAIVHAGDIGSSSVLWRLEAVAPVTAVLGNCDYSDYGPTVNTLARVTFDGVRVSLVHKPPHPALIDADISLVVHGHTHRRRDEMVGGIRFINPGSASDPRDGLPASIARVTIDSGRVTAVRFVDLV